MRKSPLKMIVNHAAKSHLGNSQAPHYGPNYGFGKYTGSKSVTEFKKTVIVQPNQIQLSNVQNVQNVTLELINDLVKEMIESSIPVIETSENPADSSTTITVKMKIAPPDVTFASVEHDTFFLDGEKFTEKEIASAVKNTFPERFI